MDSYCQATVGRWVPYVALVVVVVGPLRMMEAVEAQWATGKAAGRLLGSCSFGRPT